MSSSASSSSDDMQETTGMVKSVPYGAAPGNGSIVVQELPSITNASDDPEEYEDDDSIFMSTKVDARDMRRLGRTQELTRQFRTLSMLSWTVIVQATWEFVIVSMHQGLYDGGRAGMVWSVVWTFAGFLPIVASLAEMASMAPTSGGQYHWVSEFAPERFQKSLSYFSGWQATLSWQAGNAAGPFVTGTLVQALIFVNNPEYEGTNWQGTLLVIANVILVYLANIYGTKLIPFVQNGLLALHVLLFFAVIIPLWILAPHPPAKAVFTEFYDGGKWGNMGVALMVGQISAIWGALGSDAAAHMSEEVKDASRSVPIAMMGSYILNGLLGIVVVTTVCFAIPDLHAALDDKTGYEFLYAFRGAMSTGWSIALTTGILIVIFASNVSYLASTARETFAFARDKGLPFADWISQVHPTRHIPANALLLTSCFSIALSLIYIGNDTAFYAIVSLNVVALMATYFMSIGCILWRRIACPETLPKARWSLGRWGIPINIAGFAYAFWAFFWAFWPEQRHVNLNNFNWAVVMFGAVNLVCVVLFGIRGRKDYSGPVVLVEGRGILLRDAKSAQSSSRSR